jgi:hypothetical protein
VGLDRLPPRRQLPQSRLVEIAVAAEREGTGNRRRRRGGPRARL